MPRIEVYQSSQEFTTKTAEAPQTAPMDAQAKGMMQIGQAAIEVGQIYEKARDTAEYTTAKNNLSLNMNKAVEEAQNHVINPADGDFTKELNAVQSKYQQRLNAARTNYGTITNKALKASFEQEASLNEQIYGQKIAEIFRRKQIEHQGVELVKGYDSSLKNYIQSSGVTAKAVADNFRSSVKQSFDVGLISEKDYYAYEQKMKTWELERLANDASADPSSAIENYKSGAYAIEEDQKDKAQEILKSSYSNWKSFNSLRNLKEQQANETDFNAKMFSENAVPEQLMLDIDRMELEGKVSSDYAESARRCLKDTNRLTQATNNEVMSEILLQIDDVNMQYEDGMNDESEEEYLRAINAIHAKIADTKGLSLTMRGKLNNVLRTRSSKKQAEATAGLTNSIKYSQAGEVFNKTLPSYMRGSAMRKFFNATDGKELDDDAQAQMAYKICDELRGKSRDEILKTEAQAKKTEPQFRTAKMRDKSGKVYNVKVFKDGRREIIGISE